MVFRALLSLHPKAYKVELTRNDFFVTMVGGVKLCNRIIRQQAFNKKVSELETENAIYIDLVELEERREESTGRP